MRSDEVKKGIERAPARSLLKAIGFTDEELEKPLIGVVNSWNELLSYIFQVDLEDETKGAKKIKQTNIVSDDSRIFWQCFFKYNGDYRVKPLYYPISMDANVARSFFRTLIKGYVIRCSPPILIIFVLIIAKGINWSVIWRITRFLSPNANSIFPAS